MTRHLFVFLLTACTPQAPICNLTLEGRVLQDSGWRSFDDESLIAYAIRAVRGEIELLDGHGERETLMCHDPLNPLVKWPARQRWYRVKQ